MYNDKDLTYEWANKALDYLVLLTKYEDVKNNMVVQKQYDIHLDKLRKFITELYVMIPENKEEST